MYLVMDTNDAADYSHDSRYSAECAWPEADLETAVNVLKQILRFLYIRERERGDGMDATSGAVDTFNFVRLIGRNGVGRSFARLIGTANCPRR